MLRVAPTDLELPALGVLALVAEGNDVARVAASLNVTCQTVRGLAAGAARDVLTRYTRTWAADAAVDELDGYAFAALIARVKSVVRSDVLTAMSLLTARERLEIFESFAYYRAFCNSPVQLKEQQYG